jgi:hypothetical protein
MRLSGIDTIAAGNAFLPAFLEKYTGRFAKVPFDDRDVHRTLVVGHDDLDDAFAWKEERTVSMNLTLQYDQVLFVFEPTGDCTLTGAIEMDFNYFLIYELTANRERIQPSFVAGEIAADQGAPNGMSVCC